MTNDSLKRAVRAYQAEHGCSYSAAFHAVTRLRETERRESVMSLGEFTEAVVCALNGLGVPAVAQRRDRVAVSGHYLLSLSRLEYPGSQMPEGLAESQVVRLATYGMAAAEPGLIAERDVTYRVGDVPAVVGFVKATLAQNRREHRQDRTRHLERCAWCGTAYPRTHLAAWPEEPLGPRRGPRPGSDGSPGEHALDVSLFEYERRAHLVDLMRGEVVSGYDGTHGGTCPPCLLDPDAPTQEQWNWAGYMRSVTMACIPGAPALWAGIATALTAFGFEHEHEFVASTGSLARPHSPAWDVLDQVPDDWWDTPAGTNPEVEEGLVSGGLSPVQIRLLPRADLLAVALEGRARKVDGSAYDGGMSRLPARVREEWTVQTPALGGVPPTAVPVWLPPSAWLDEHAATPALAARLRALGGLTSVPGVVGAIESAMPELMRSTLAEVLHQILLDELDRDDEPLEEHEIPAVTPAIMWAVAITEHGSSPETIEDDATLSWIAEWAFMTARDLWPVLRRLWPALLTCAVTGCTDISEHPDRRQPWGLLTDETDEGILGDLFRAFVTVEVDTARDSDDPDVLTWDSPEVDASLFRLWRTIPRLAQTLFPGVVDTSEVESESSQPLPLRDSPARPDHTES